MECLLGMAFNEFVILAADQTSSHSILVVKQGKYCFSKLDSTDTVIVDENKLYKLSEKLLLSVCGESGDTNQFAEFIEKNIQLYKMRNGYDLSPCSAATWTRRNLADSLRSRVRCHSLRLSIELLKF